MSSPPRFVKPSDLFNMRRRTSNQLLSTPNNSSNHNSNSASMSRLSPIKQQSGSSPVSLAKSLATTPNKNRVSQFGPGLHLMINSQSPLKCLDNNASPSKLMPSLLKNPFHQPVKRRLNLCSPRKKHPHAAASPVKRSRRMLELDDEDANLEPSSRIAATTTGGVGACCRNDWTLKSVLRINFVGGQCQNFKSATMSTCSNSGLTSHASQSSCSSQDTQIISVSSLKKASKVYQHPYLSWLPLYPRCELDDHEINSTTARRAGNSISFGLESEAAALMHKDWCDSLTDVFVMLTEGTCPYFYLCAPLYTVLFRRDAPANADGRPTVSAHISLLGRNLAKKLAALGIKYNVQTFFQPHPPKKSSPSLENSQTSSQALADDLFIDENCEGADMVYNHLQNISNDLPAWKPSDTSHTASKLSEEDSVLGFDDTSRQVSGNYKPMASIQGAEDVSKFIEFLQTNDTHTIIKLGRYAYIPPTILAPCEFYLSAPRYPLVKSINKTSFKVSNPKLSPRKQEVPESFELTGPILPSLFNEIHKLLSKSENNNHTCIPTLLPSTKHFEAIAFSL